MSEVERLEDELALARSKETLEAARDAMHKNRNVNTIRAFKQASRQVAQARSALRRKYPPPPPPEGDGVAMPETVRASAKVRKAGGAS